MNQTALPPHDVDGDGGPAAGASTLFGDGLS